MGLEPMTLSRLAPTASASNSLVTSDMTAASNLNGVPYLVEVLPVLGRFSH
jgi:hypothetical protein